MRFSRMLKVKGNIERAFDLTEKYMLGMKFEIVESNRPTLLVLKRGSSWGALFSTKIENYKTKLTISFTQKDADVIIVCDYIIQDFGSIITSGDKLTLESELELFKSMLETSL